MIIHSHIPKRKKRKPTARQRELQASWEAILKKYEPKKPVKVVQTYVAPKPYVRETPNYPSLRSGYHDTTKKTVPVYTGDKLVGIGTLHKSNAVPIFNTEDAVDQANMRR